MKPQVSRILQSRFVRNALTLGGGTALGQALVFAVTPVLTRRYGPDAMAMLGLYLAFAAPATVALALRYDVAIVVARTTEDARTLLVANLAILPFTAAAGGASFLALSAAGVGGYGAFPWWAAPAMTLMLLMTGAFTSLRFWAVREGDFRLIGQGLVIQGGARALAPLACSLFTASWVGLLVGELAGRAFGVRRLLDQAWETIRATAASLDRRAVRACLRTYHQFPLLHLPSSIVDAIGGNLPIPMFTAAFGASDGGQFFLAQRVVLVPATLLGAAVADVYHHRIVEAARVAPARCGREVARAGGYLLAAGIAIYLPAALLAPRAAPWVFGPAWEATGWAIAALAPAAVTATVTSPLSRAISLSRVPQAKWVADVVRFGLPVGAIAAASAGRLTFPWAVAAYAGATVVGDLVYFVVILYTVAPHRLRALAGPGEG